MSDTLSRFRRAPLTRRPAFRHNRTGAARVALIAALSAIGLLAVGGALGYRYLTSRPGEAAADRYLPADSVFVSTLDLKPSSPEQAGVFARIGDALRRAGLDRRATDAVEQATGRSSVAREVLPYLTGGAAFAARDTQSGSDVVALLTIRDTQAVGEILTRRAVATEKAPDGFVIASVPTDGPKPVYVAVLDNYLVVARSKDALLRVADVRAHRAPALSSRADYRDARAGLPADANALVFVSPTAAKNLPSGSGVGAPSAALKGAGWFASSVTLRADGVLMDARLPWKFQTGPVPAVMQTAGGIAPFDTAVLRRLPSGAIGAFALSQPGRYADAARTGAISAGGDAAAQETARRAMNESMAGFERTTGMSVDRDILPNLGGNVVLVAYPRPSGANNSDGTPPADGLVIFDDAHGADPAALAAKVRTAIERASDDRARFIRDGDTANGATIWRLTEGEPEKGLVIGDARNGGVSVRFNENGLRVAPVGNNAPHGSLRVDDRGVSLTGDAGTVTVNQNGGGIVPAPGLLSASAAQTSGGNDVLQIVEKTAHGSGRAVMFAEVGKSVLVASSPALLARAVEAYRSNSGAPSLAGDRLTPGAQMAFLVSPAAVRNAFAPLWKNASQSVNGKTWTPDDVFALLGANQTSAAPVAVSARYDGGVLRASAFVPVDYEKAVALASARK